MEAARGNGDFGRMIEFVARERLPRRPDPRFRDECHPGSHNTPLIMAVLHYVGDALDGAPDERVARRLVDLQECIAAAKAAQMLPAFLDSDFARLTAAVQDVAVERRANARFDDAIALCEADARDALRLPADPPAGALDAIARVGGLAMDRARAVYNALASACTHAAGAE